MTALLNVPLFGRKPKSTRPALDIEGLAQEFLDGELAEAVKSPAFAAFATWADARGLGTEEEPDAPIDWRVKNGKSFSLAIWPQFKAMARPPEISTFYVRLTAPNGQVIDVMEVQPSLAELDVILDGLPADF